MKFSKPQSAQVFRAWKKHGRIGDFHADKDDPDPALWWWLHQPAAWMLAHLDAIGVGCEAVHAAFDFCAGQAEVERLRNWFDSHIFQRFSTAPVIRCRTTDYFARAEAPRGLVIYSDRPSKINGTPCVHVELRINGDPLNQLGIRCLASLRKVNWQNVFKQVVGFVEVDLRALGRALLGRSHAKRITAQQAKDELQIGWALSRDYRSGEPSAAVARAICNERQIDSRRVLSPVEMPPEWGVIPMVTAIV